MSSFETIGFDLTIAEAELNSFKAWFAGQGFIGETAIVAESASADGLPARVGPQHPGAGPH